MAKAEVTQVNSKNGNAFFNVDEEYNHVNVWTSTHSHEAYILYAGNQYHFVQFVREAPRAEIDAFLKERAEHYKILKIEADGLFIQIKP